MHIGHASFGGSSNMVMLAQNGIDVPLVPDYLFLRRVELVASVYSQSYKPRVSECNRKKRGGNFYVTQM